MTNVNNLSTIVDGPYSGQDPTRSDRPQRSWLRRWWWLVALLTVIALIGGVIVWSVTTYVPYVVESPGSVYTTGERISINGTATFSTTDKIDLVTVSLDTRVTHFEKFVADHNNDDIVIPAKDVLGNQTAAQNDDLNALLMKQSKDAAVLVALQRMGYNVHPTQSGAVVDETVPGAPADGVIKVAETIVALNDQPVTSKDQLISILTTFKPGDQVTVTLEAAADRARRTVNLKLADNPKSPGVGFIGVAAEDRLDYPDLPVTVKVDSGTIGGPSAGLAFTLGILDLLTPGDMTGGKEVAATGTMSADGTVGEIGGIESKVTTVSRAGVKYFLVPVEDAAAAQAHAPKDLQIVPVHTLDDALKFLASIGGTGFPPAPAPSGS
jgi:Lon-like protease